MRSDNTKKIFKEFSGFFKFRSLRFLLILLILICGILPVFLTGRIYISSQSRRQLHKLIISVQGQCSLIAADIAKYSYMTDHNIDFINAEIEQLISQYSARVIIVDNNFKIIKDTYSISEGKYYITRNVINAAKGSSGVDSDVLEGFADITIPIYAYETTDVIGVFNITITDMGIKEDMEYRTKLSISVLTVVSLIMLVIAFIASHFIVKPLNKLAESVRHIAMGSKNAHVEKRTLYEYDEVAQAVNDMLDRMQSLDESREMFVSNVSHELKTPMTSIKVLADSIVNEEDVPIEIYREFMDDIVKEIDRENKIINDLLTLVKVDRAEAELNISTVNVNELVELVLKRLKPIAAQRNIELVLESFRPVAAEIDEVKFTLAINNLVENAIKYNRNDGWVHVSINANHKYFFIKVEDSGIGIPADCTEKIFDRFYRVDKARSRQTGGTGLGLAIVKSVILMHKGSIKLYSREDEGTTFTVRVPMYNNKSQGDVQ